MKLINVLVILLFLAVLPSSRAICCEAGCYPAAQKCCQFPLGTSSQGFVGCYDSLSDDYVCPGTALGECLECVCLTTSEECTWQPSTTMECNGCEVTYDDKNYPIDSTCSNSCGNGETKCADGVCRPPECCTSICCTIDPGDCCLGNSDGTCDTDCIINGFINDPDCGGGETCGDGTCGTTEDCSSCSSDCGICPTPTCGDNICAANEDCSSCPSDCGTCITPAPCGNGVCEPNENCNSCSSDCGICPTPTCGNGVCEPNENCNSCSSDCGTCDLCIGTCNDGCCDSNEDCSSCPSDCGTCITPAPCGNGVCEPNENCDSCSSDCGICPIPTCGDNVCAPNEDCSSCSADCGTCKKGICTSSQGDCCHPYKDNICDLDCVDGIDPDCQTTGTSFNDGICHAITDSICDVNCIAGVDMPDCTDITCTNNPNDCCIPLTDGKCDLDCPLDLDPNCLFIPGYADCDNDGFCDGDFESCICNDCIEDPSNACLTGLFCCSGVCSGDVDEDLICDYDDYCINVFDHNQDPDNQADSDEDCLIDLERSSLFGNCGDACDTDGNCFDIYGSKQCCDDIAGSSPTGSFYGFTDDCPKIGETSIGCWSKCIQTDSEGNIITYEIGQCIEETRIVSKLVNNRVVQTTEEPCTSIPLIPFYTNLSIVLTILILIIFYRKRN